MLSAYDFLTTVDVSEKVVAAGELVICHQGGEDDRLVDKDSSTSGVLGAGHGVIPRLQGVDVLLTGGDPIQARLGPSQLAVGVCFQGVFRNSRHHVVRIRSVVGVETSSLPIVANGDGASVLGDIS